MVDALKRTFKRHIDSTNPFWWYAIEFAAFLATVAGWCALPAYLAYHWKDARSVRSIRKKIREGRVVIAFGLSREHFGKMYAPIVAKLPKNYDAWFIIPNASRKPSNSSCIHACWSLFVPWNAYMSCWFSIEHPDPIDVRSGKLNIQMYHGVGDAYISERHIPPHSNLLYRKELQKFNVHFATGPIIKRTVESFGPGHACIDVGYPKTDFLFHETPIPAVVTEDCTFENDAPLVVYAPHHHAAASLTRYGFKIVEELLNMNVHIVVKLHNLMLEPDNPLRSSLATIEMMACHNPRLRIARDPEPGHYYKMADVVVGDTGNSTAFESFLCKTPVVLVRGTNVEMFTDNDPFETTMMRLSTTIGDPSELSKAIKRALKVDSDELERCYRESLRFLYNPGHATDVAVKELTKAISEEGGCTPTRRKISFVIPAFNEEKYIADCLASITKLRGDPWVHEIIVVVDDATTDATASIAAAFPGVTVVRSEAHGIAKARAKGLEVASGDLYASIDADCRIAPGWLDEVKNRFSNDEKLIGLVGEYTYYDMPWMYHFLIRSIAMLTSIRLWLLRREKNFSRGGNSVFSIEKLRTAHGFDSKTAYFGEDVYTTLSMRKLGRVMYNPRMRVYSSARRMNNEGFWKMLLLFKANVLWQRATGKPLFPNEVRHWR